MFSSNDSVQNTGYISSVSVFLLRSIPEIPVFVQNGGQYLDAVDIVLTTHPYHLSGFPIRQDSGRADAHTLAVAIQNGQPDVAAAVVLVNEVLNTGNACNVVFDQPDNTAVGIHHGRGSPHGPHFDGDIFKRNDSVFQTALPQKLLQCIDDTLNGQGRIESAPDFHGCAPAYTARAAVSEDGTDIQNKGIGKALMSAVDDAMIENSVKEISLHKTLF